MNEVFLGVFRVTARLSSRDKTRAILTFLIRP